MNAKSEKLSSLDILMQLNLSHEELLKFAAKLMEHQLDDELEIEKLTLLINSMMQALQVLRFTCEKSNGVVGEALLKLLAENENAVANGLMLMQKYQITKQASNAGLARVKNSKQNKAIKEIEMEFHKVSSQFKRHGYGAEFCRKMQDKYSEIRDIKTIAKLVTKLKKSIPL